MKANFNEKTMSAILSVSAENYKGFSKAEDLKPMLKAARKLWEQGLRLATAKPDKADAMYERFTEKAAAFFQTVCDSVTLSPVDYVSIYSLMGIRFGTSKGEGALRYNSESTFKKSIMEYTLRAYAGDSMVSVKESDQKKLEGKKAKDCKSVRIPMEEVLRFQNMTIEEKAAFMDKYFTAA